mgnify:CR=1 FL=1
MRPESSELAVPLALFSTLFIQCKTILKLQTLYLTLKIKVEVAMGLNILFKQSHFIFIETTFFSLLLDRSAVVPGQPQMPLDIFH